jgi:hypothetical protein
MKRAIRLGSVLLALLLTALWLSVATTEEGSAALDGKGIFLAQKCDMCHAVPSQGIQAKVTSANMKGPDIAGKPTASGEQMAKYLRKQAQINGKDHKKEFTGTDEELRALVAWMESLKAE